MGQNDLTSKVASSVRTLAEFLDDEAVQPPHKTGKALLHGHCHEKATLRFDAQTKVLEKTGLDVQAPVTGCCGMAGSFGFEDGKYEVSQAVGETALLPKVRQAQDRILIADGFSCREQVLQATGRRPLHLAELLDPEG